ncbi:MAG: hypothetical protein KC776_30600 [Myxococcales bacterium]|nr:hypothetical protein [Myxococcales bacterium]
MDVVERVEPLRHVERVRQLVELGRAARAGDAGANDAIEALAAAPDRYRRCLAVASCYGSRDPVLVQRMLGDTSRAVRRRAQKAAAVVLDDDAVVVALSRAPSRVALRQLVALLVQRRRLAPLQRFLAQALDAEPELVGHAAPDVLPKYVEGLSPDGLRRAARRHPEELARLFEARVASSFDPRTRYQLLAVLPLLAKHAAAATLPLVKRLLEQGTEPKHWLSASMALLLRREPILTFDLLRQLRESLRPMPPPGPFGAVRFDKVVHQLDDERLAYLVEHAAATLSDGPRARRWFLRLSAAQREIVIDGFLRHGRGRWGAFLLRYVPPESKDRERAFRRFRAAAQNEVGVIPLAHLTTLPRDLKAREARRHLEEVPALATRPEERIAYAALLPLDEAAAALASFTSHPDGPVRAVAMRALATVPATYPEAMAGALERVASRRFEQDPVRQAMLLALSELPLRAFSREILPALSEVFQHALDAADLSPTTSFHIERTCVRLFRRDAPWAAEWLSKLLAVRGVPSSLGLVDGLTPREAQALAPAVETLCQEWTHRERVGALLWLARSFGDRLAQVPALVRALETVASEQPFVQVAGPALDLLRRHAPERFRELFPALLASDASAIVLPAVSRAVSTSRQDLLPPFLKGEVIKGRFASGRSQWVIEFDAGLGTWSAAQQRAQAGLLAAMVHDPKRDVPTLRRGVGALAMLDFAPFEHWTALAEDERPPMRELVTRALGRVDDPMAPRQLLEALGDERSRWAIYALRAVLRELAQERVLALLRQAPMSKVTVAKEVLRLAGELAGREGFEFLIGLDRGALHRDVKIALLRALWDHLDDERSWAVFAEALADPDWVVASRLADVPVARLAADAERRLTELLAQVLARPEPEARRYLLARAAYLPLVDRDRLLFQSCLAHLGAPYQDEVTTALAAVLQRMAPNEAPQVLDRICELIDRRRTFRTLHTGLVARLGPYASVPVLAVGRGLLERIEPEPTLVPESLALAAVLRSEGELVALLTRLSQRSLLHFDAMGAAVAAIGRAVRPGALEALLRDADDPRLRRLGLAALELAARPKRGWTKERRAVLEGYRADPDPLVAGHARFVFPPERRRKKPKP